MTSDEIKQNISGWCTPDSGLEIAGDRSDSGSDLALGVRYAGLSGAPVDLEVTQAPGADRVAIRHTASASDRSKDAAQALIDQRPGWIVGTVDSADTGTSVKLETFVYLDGLNRNSFMQAVAEVARTARLLGGLSTTAAATPAATVSAMNAGSPVPAGAGAAYGQSATPVAQPSMPAPSFSPQPQPQYQPQPAYQQQPQYQPQYQPQPAQSGGWAPTHSVPPQGLRAWAAPDPSGPVVANLAPGLPIQVSEVRGAWARVICSNGWTGWVDGRIIGVAA
jgi:Bacterial SH3 domain